MIVCLASIGGCGTSFHSSCDGWRQITVKRATALYINQNDGDAAHAIISHNEFGERLGCWKVGK